MHHFLAIVYLSQLTLCRVVAATHEMEIASTPPIAGLVRPTKETRQCAMLFFLATQRTP